MDVEREQGRYFLGTETRTPDDDADQRQCASALGFQQWTT